MAITSNIPLNRVSQDHRSSQLHSIEPKGVLEIPGGELVPQDSARPILCKHQSS